MDIENRTSLDPDDAIGHNQAELTVVMVDGRTLEARTECARGNPDNPLSWEDLETKFSGVTEPILGAGSGELFSVLRNFDTPGSLAAFDGLVSAEPAARAAE
jgi:2-methylcitrate dehydratase PrpD